MKKIPLGLMIGAALAGCFWIGESDAQAHFKNGQWYVHQKRVSLQLVGQTCCNPTNTFYRIRWGHHGSGLVYFPCTFPHARITFAKPTTRRKGRVWITGCGVLKIHTLRPH